ncbi:hypothetical protein MKX03_005548 [Papaver bracteatum]|nr:hypothetical protein MKX03_005548 [Papaver bracteatum]
MEKKKFNMKQFWRIEGTENPNNHLHSSDNSMEMINDKFQQVSVNTISDERNLTSDNHILCDILSRLPIKSLMRFKSVSKHWKSLIEVDSYLHDLHYKRSKSGLCGQRIVLFISSTEPDFNNPLFPYKKPDNHAIKFSIRLPGSRKFVVKKLVLDRSPYGIPKQAVNGLVCITSGGEAFFIHNPSTGERSPWIETTTVSEGNAGDGKRQVRCIGFGFNPKTNEHKVICISSIEKLKKRGEINWDFSYKDEEIEDQVCEVLVVGENTWRRIDEVPPYNMRTKDCYGGGMTFNWDNNSVYVNGSLYWRFRYTRKGEVIVGFDFGTEKFRVIPIPDSAIDPRVYKFSQTVELMEVDGHIAVLKWISEYHIALWILNEDGDSIKWIEEKIDFPFMWNAKPDLSIEALPGTNLIILKPEYECETDSFYYYDRSTKKFTLSKIPPEYHFELRQITSLVESLAPVRAARCSTF